MIGRFVSLLVLVVLGFLAYAGLPMLWSDNEVPRAPWIGPKLSELEYDEISIRSNNITLAALVFEPEGPVKAALTVIHGSGPSYRDHGWYTELVRVMRSRGIAVMLPDKRGSENSEGNWHTASMEDLAEDATAVLSKSRQLWPNVPIGILGTSQGGWVAPIAALNEPVPDFVINQSGAATPAREQLVFEEINTLTTMGMPRPAAQLIAPISAWTIRKFRQTELWSNLDGFDPIRYWKKVNQPTVVVYGELDEFDNVPVALSVARLTALAKDNINVEVLNGVGHSLNKPGSGSIDTRFYDLISNLALAN